MVDSTYNGGLAFNTLDAHLKIIIKGITESGGKFRPSDWAQRLATAAGSSDRMGRIQYHPKVAVVIHDGINCVVIDKSLEDEEPMLYSFLTDFAISNKLQIEEKP